VLTQLAGATMRACVVILVIATPALMIPGTSPEGAQGA